MKECSRSAGGTAPQNQKKPSIYALDRLTSLASSEYFYHLAEQQIKADQMANRLFFVYFNVDSFKAFNSDFGYKAGNRFLRELANLLTATFRGDVIGRTSNDHFILLTSLSGAEIEEKVRYVHNEMHNIETNARVELHAGIYEYEQGVSVTQCHDRAKIACDTVKGNFSRLFAYFDDELREAITREKYIVDNIDAAVRNEYLAVYYQPIVRVFSGKVCAMESLVRWNDPELGFLQPGEFIPILERRRLIHKVDTFMLDKVCRDIVRFRTLGETVVPVSVNLSRLDFQLMDVYKTVTETVAKYGIEPRFIHLEVTESALNEDEEALLKTVSELQSAGFELWLDDFGSEYSTLNTLQNFNFDLLKIDMKFFENFATNKKAGVIIATIADLAKRLHMRVLAEGIETKEQLDFLKEIGCDKAQGYYISRPQPLDVLYSAKFKQEKETEQEYYTAIGQVNFLSPNPFDDDTGTDKIDNMVAAAVGEYRNDRFYYLYTNESFMRCLQSLGVKSLEDSDININDDTAKLRTRLAGCAVKCHHSGKMESLDFIFNGHHVNLRAREIAHNSSAQAFYVTIINLSAMENVRKIDRLETSLNFLYTMYDRVDMLDPIEDKIENIYLSSMYYETSFDGKALKEGIEAYGRTDIEPGDQNRFLEFYNIDTLEQRFSQHGKSYLVQPLRTLTHKKGIVPQLYIIVRINEDGKIRYLSCVRDLNEQVVDEYDSINAPADMHDSYWYQLMCNELQVSVFEWNLKTGEAHASGRAYRYLMCRNSMDDILANTGSLESIYPEDLPVAHRFFAESKSGQPRAEATLRLKMVDGTYRWSRVIGLFDYDGNGMQLHVTGIIIDVDDEHTNLEQASFLNQMPTALGVFEVVDGTVRQLFMNDGYYRLVEDEREHRQRQNDASFITGIHPEDRPLVLAAIRSVIDGADSCGENCRVRTGNGQYKWIHFASSVAERTENRLLVYSTYVSIEGEMQVAHDKTETSRMLEITLNNANMVVWEFDCIHHCITQTESSREKHGYPRHIENVPQSLVDSGYLHTDSVKPFLKMYSDLQEKKQRVQGDFYVRSAGSEAYWWERIVLTPIFDEDGSLTKAIGTSIDISKEIAEEAEKNKQR